MLAYPTVQYHKVQVVDVDILPDDVDSTHSDDMSSAISTASLTSGELMVSPCGSPKVV